MGLERTSWENLDNRLGSPHLYLVLLTEHHPHSRLGGDFQRALILQRPGIVKMPIFFTSIVAGVAKPLKETRAR